jgi:hypothetical protein
MASVGERGDTDALVKLRVACDLAVDAAQQLGKPLPTPLEQQILDLCSAIQTELEARDKRFADPAKRS